LVPGRIDDRQSCVSLWGSLSQRNLRLTYLQDALFRRRAWTRDWLKCGNLPTLIGYLGEILSKNDWHDAVPDGSQFEAEKRISATKLSSEHRFRPRGLSLQVELTEYGFGHKNSWMGVPIIRLPEDIMLQQELIWQQRPDLIVEIGVARGGGLLFNASMQDLCGLKPKVLGVDNKIYPHTRSAVSQSRYHESIILIEGNSVDPLVVGRVEGFTEKSEKTLLVLDSDHSSEHVFNELRAYVPILPQGSLVVVCDTLIDELPAGTYKGRTWENGKGPLDAIRRFLGVSGELEPFMVDETRGLVLTEIREGILRKIRK